MTQEPSHVRQGNTMNGKTFEQEEALYAVRAYRAIEGEVRSFESDGIYPSEDFGQYDNSWK